MQFKAHDFFFPFVFVSSKKTLIMECSYTIFQSFLLIDAQNNPENTSFFFLMIKITHIHTNCIYILMISIVFLSQTVFYCMCEKWDNHYKDIHKVCKIKPCVLFTAIHNIFKLLLHITSVNSIIIRFAVLI